MTSTPQVGPDRTTRLNPTALSSAFGVAGLVVAVIFGAITGGMWGMMGGAGWMHGSVGGGPGYGGSMMSGGLGYFLALLVCGFLGGAIVGGVSASVYNYVARRTA